MLEPDVRTLLFDALRPGPGERIEHCVATTFTLDLTAALMTPIALAGFSLSGPSPDVLAMMQALRSTAAQLDIFCQAGMISSSAGGSDLLALLEGSVHQVRRPPHQHLFHPKVWVVKLAGPDGPSYRCVVASRNLTLDRSWDVVLRLDSDPSVHKTNFGNEGLVRLLRAMPEMTLGRLDAEREERLRRLADEVGKVWWQLPDGVEGCRFLEFGLRHHRRIDTDELFHGYRHLLISPFLTADGIATLVGSSAKTDLTIVSRADQLDQLVAADLPTKNLWSLDPLASADHDEQPAGSLTGDLHAKVYVIEATKRAFVYVGSPNATGMAFGGNVELLCELSGAVKNLGVDQFIGKGGLAALLQPYELPPEPVVDVLAEARRRLDFLLIDIAEAGFRVDVKPVDDLWQMHLTTDSDLSALPIGLGVDLTIAPLNSPNEPRPLTPGRPVDAQYDLRTPARVTPFFLVSAHATIDGVVVDGSTVVAASMVGGPPDRLDAVIVEHLRTPEDFLRFLLLLLSFTSGQPMSADANTASHGAGAWGQGPTTSGLLELLVRSLAANSSALDHLDAIVERLERDEQLQLVLPDGWSAVWPAIQAARQKIREGQPA